MSKARALVASSGHAQIEVEGHVYVAAGIIGRERREVLDGEQRARGGIVHGTIAAGFGDANIFDGAVAIDGESESGFGATGGTDSGIDGVLQPVLIHGATHGFDIPAIARGEI